MNTIRIRNTGDGGVNTEITYRGIMDSEVFRVIIIVMILLGAPIMFKTS